MEIEYLRRFVTVSQCLSFSKAAELLYVSQPTLTRSIHTLEKELDTQLFTRNTRFVKLTPEGEILLPAAAEIVECYQNAIEKINQRKTPRSNILRIGYTGPVLDKLLAAWINSFCKANPDVKVQTKRYGGAQIEAAFDNREIDFGVLFLINAKKIPRLSYQEVCNEKFKIAVSATHPMASRSKVSLDAFANDPFLICERAIAPNFVDRVMEICKRRNFRPNIIQVCGRVSDIYHLVNARLGISILSWSDAKSYAGYDLKFLDFDDEDDLMNAIVVAWMGKSTPTIHQFLEIAKEPMIRADS